MCVCAVHVCRNQRSPVTRALSPGTHFCSGSWLPQGDIEGRIVPHPEEQAGGRVPVVAVRGHHMSGYTRNFDVGLGPGEGEPWRVAVLRVAQWPTRERQAQVALLPAGGSRNAPGQAASEVKATPPDFMDSPE